MYPSLYYFFYDVFGISLPFLKIFNMFGFFMALGFFVSAWVLAKELKRKQTEGILTYTETTVTVGEGATIAKVLPSFLWGCIVGYKFIGMFFIPHAMDNAQAFIVSPDGSIICGLLAGFGNAALKWFAINEFKLSQPRQEVVKIWPSDRVSTIAIIAAVAGLIGAKIFDNLENWHRFIQDPIGNLFSRSGLTFYGGLIVATIALWYYAKKIKLRFIYLCDAAAPVLMLAYCIGRMGCQVAGDGDWGIVNSAYLTNPDGVVTPATPGTLDTAFSMYTNMYVDSIGQRVEHKSVKAFGGLPVWLFAYSYPHNTNKSGIPTFRCKFDDYCNHLPLPVFPTPLYEIIMAFILFSVLWALRKKIKMPGRLFAVYLFMNGVERLLIEQIRVNTKYHIFGFHATQAEIISSMLIAAGIGLWIYAPKIKEC